MGILTDSYFTMRLSTEDSLFVSALRTEDWSKPHKSVIRAPFLSKNYTGDQIKGDDTDGDATRTGENRNEHRVFCW